MPATTELQTSIVKQLEQKTRTGTLHWQETGRGNEFVTRMDGYAITVSINQFIEMFNAGVEVKSPVAVSIMLPEGVVIERFEVASNEAEYAATRSLYENAASRAAKKTQMLSQVFQKLSRLPA